MIKNGNIFYYIMYYT